MKTRRTALVTGANRGIGYEVAKELARMGMRAILTGRDAAAVAKAAEALRRSGGAAAALEMDVADREAVKACADRLRGEGERVDILVNNAGVYPGGSLLSAPLRFCCRRSRRTSGARSGHAGRGCLGWSSAATDAP